MSQRDLWEHYRPEPEDGDPELGWAVGTVPTATYDHQTPAEFAAWNKNRISIGLEPVSRKRPSGDVYATPESSPPQSPTAPGVRPSSSLGPRPDGPRPPLGAEGLGWGEMPEDEARAAVHAVLATRPARALWVRCQRWLADHPLPGQPSGWTALWDPLVDGDDDQWYAPETPGEQR